MKIGDSITADILVSYTGTKKLVQLTGAENAEAVTGTVTLA